MADFKQAIDIVIAAHEGGFQKRTDDPGDFTPCGQWRGTKFGISAFAFPNEDIENLTLTQAEELYQQRYGHFAAIDDLRVLAKVLDLAVNLQGGDRGAETEMLQKAVVAFGTNIDIDGIFGTFTAQGVNGVIRDCGPDALIARLCREAADYYRQIEIARPEMSKWFKNWETRAAWIPPNTDTPERTEV